MPNRMAAAMQKAIGNATACTSSCLESLNYCISTGGKHAAKAHLELLIDCSKICDMSADFMVRGSPFHADICGICADICEDCARSCDQFNGDDQMAYCARQCRACADTCREMAQMSKAA